MWPDNETDQDLLGFQVHSDLIRSIVTDSDLLPTTIGVFGDWGGGKTSVMKMLERDLDPETYPEGAEEHDRYKGVACLYFNGWLFEGYDDAKSALLGTILLQLATHKRFGEKVRERAVSLLASVDWMRVAHFALREVAVPAAAAALTGGASLFPTLLDRGLRLLGRGAHKAEEGGANVGAEPGGEGGQDAATVDVKAFIRERTETPGPADVRSFRERFQEMLEESDITTLVVLIDDLDRCSPKRIIDNLEAIKLFLSVPRTAFVIGADPRIVRHAVATTYAAADVRAEEGVASQTDIVTDYLEKVIQLPYTLPRLSPTEVETYMSLLFCRRGLDQEPFKKVLEASVKHRERDRFTVFGLGAIQATEGVTLLDGLNKSLTFSNLAAPLITEGLKGNPRQVKRFLNAYALRKKLAEVARLGDIKDDVMVKLMVLEYARPRQFTQLYEWQASQSGVPKEVRDLERALRDPDGGIDNEQGAKAVDEEWGALYLRRWIAMDPLLSDVDLRDYFWVARDRLQTTLANVALVPPIVRRTFESLISDVPAKRTEAITVAKNFDGSETGHLLDLLERHASRQPSQTAAFEALMELGRDELPGSIAVLSKLLQNLPADQLDPSLGVSLLRLTEEREDMADALGSAIDHLRRTGTGIAAALKPRSRRPKPN